MVTTSKVAINCNKFCWNKSDLKFGVTSVGIRCRFATPWPPS